MKAKRKRSLELFRQEEQAILKGDSIMENIKVEKVSEELSKEELLHLAKAQTMPVVFDDDCPETTPEQALEFKRVSVSKRASGE